MDDFLTPDELQRLTQAFETRLDAGLFKPAKVGVSPTRVDSIRGDETCWIAADSDHELAWLFERLDQLKVAMNETLLLGLWDLECHFARYPEGAGYERHIDRFASNDRRVLSMVIYLNAHWQPSDGGALRVHPSAENGLNSPKDIAPQGGRLVLFLSDSIAHEVMPAHRERRSLTGWFRRRGDRL